MKYFIAGCALLFCVLNAQGAGFQSLDIPGPKGKPIALAMWYPSKAASQSLDMGSFHQDVASNGAIDGTGLPLVIISHGTGGYKYSHHDTARDVADAGFVVVAITHPGDNYADQSGAIDILERPKHIVMALDYILKEWPQKDSIAASRIGIFGFSSGGFTALVSVGGQPDLGKVFAHCAAHPSHYACALIARHDQLAKTAQTAATPQMHDRRIRAAVIAAPALGFTFDAAALSKVDIPLQLWRAEDDRILPHPWYAETVRLSLGAKPDHHVVPNAGHFDFLAPCTDRLAAMAPQICVSQPGFDRAAFHRRFNADVIGHFKKFL
jgi:predicted dienelactone hydrolase